MPPLTQAEDAMGIPIRNWKMEEPEVMSTKVARPTKVRIIGASGTYGRGVLAHAEEIGVEAVVITRSPHKFEDMKPTNFLYRADNDV